MNNFSKVLIGVIIVSAILIFVKPVVRVTTEWAANDLKQIDVQNEYDVIVVGTDPEGIAAAVASARSGAKTLLLGKEESLGGLFTLGMLNSIDMNRNESGELLTRGIFQEFYQKIGSKDSFDIEKAKMVFEEMVTEEEKLTYLPNHSFVEPILSDKTIIGVKMNYNNNDVSFFGKRIIDATQDGDVVAKSQDEIVGGSAEGSLYFMGMSDLNLTEKMAATLVFKVEGVDWAQLEIDIENYKKATGDIDCGINDSSAWGFGKWCYDKYVPRHSNMKLRGPNMGRQEDDTVLINALQIFNINGLDKKSIEEAKKLGNEEIKNILAYFKNIIPAFKNAKLVDVADELYIRETRHIKGEYVLTATDILDNTNFEDKIALGSYPIDIQSTNMNNTGYVIGKPLTYSIPLRCLIPLEVENIFIVGKAASYSSIAAGSARVVPVGMAAAESAGIIAVYSIVEEMTPREIAYDEEALNEINILLKEQGVYLPEFNYKTTIPDIENNAIRKILNLGYLSAGYNNNYRLEEDATVASLAASLINGIQRTSKEKYTIDMVYNVRKYYSEDKLTALRAGEMIASLFEYELEEDDKWKSINKQGYLADIGTDLEEEQILNKRQLYILTVNTLERYLGRELK
ncbi:MAG: FAD-dependent oxidoreductase [Clostridiales bacterium]|nr:FAD-dependent oxidoreductase [Clostridiales bacterium]